MHTPTELPGPERLRLLQACADDVERHATTSFEDEPWSLLARLDERQAFRTRWAARAILQRESDGAVLVFRYPPYQGRDRWVLPGGGVEAGETALAGVLREIVEETGAVPRDLVSTGFVFAHGLPPLGDDPRVRVQYSPIFLGRIDDHLPDVGGRPVVWHTLDQLAARTDALHLCEASRLLRAGEAYRPATVWAP